MPTVRVLDHEQGELIGELSEEEQRLVLRHRAADVLYDLRGGEINDRLDGIADGILDSGGEVGAVDARTQYRLASCVAQLLEVVDATCTGYHPAPITEEQIDAIELAIYGIVTLRPGQPEIA